MLPKKRRIERKDFGNILKGGKRHNSPSLLLYVANNKDKTSQFSFSVSKKVCSKAIDRNRLRRLGYSVISKNIEKLPNGSFFFFVFKKGSQNIRFSDLEKEILGLL